MIWWRYRLHMGVVMRYQFVLLTDLRNSHHDYPEVESMGVCQLDFMGVVYYDLDLCCSPVRSNSLLSFIA
jgi:hypothetical protein